eukprot:TRINITY_DN23613_c0_g1_i6.p1 TRINITY_DN23613_c0_g1~~TRINITY_DN23613_c0_g1_i6.p1  ORF type:complete len:504 (-),score=53.20 TRINITY_DN23613_c0_g1_i6:393-1904(-)
MALTKLHVVTLLLAGWFAACDPEACMRPGTLREALVDPSIYDRETRPGLGGPPLEVKLQIYVNAVVNIFEHKEEIEVEGYFRQFWTDPQLARSAANSSGLCTGVFQIPQSEWGNMWIPDSYFVTSISESYSLGMLQIAESGRIWFSQRIRHVFRCPMDFSRLPFDTQSCRISVSPYAHNDAEVVVAPSETPFEMPVGYDGTTAWSIKKLAAAKETVYYGVGSDRQGWSSVNFDLTFARRPQPQVRRTVGTCMIFFFVSWCGMYINRKAAPARVAMSVIPLLIMLNLTNNVMSGLPTIEGWTWLTSFLTASMTFTVLVIFEYAVVGYLMHLEDVVRVDKFQALQGIAAKALNLRTRASSTSIDIHMCEDVKPDVNVPSDNSEARHAQSIIQYLFTHFDTSNKGAINPQCLRRAFRSYGLYYSVAQTAEMFRSVGVPDGELMDLMHFEELVVNLKKHMPTKELQPSYFDFPPSLRFDIGCRYAFLLAYLLMLLVFMVVAAGYEDE